MATSFKTAPYVLLPGANTLAGVRGVQDSVTMLQDLLAGKPMDKYESPSEIIRMRDSIFKTNVSYLENVIKPTMYVYTGFIDRPLLQEYVDYAKSTFVKENFVVPADVYGQTMIYNPDNGAFKIQSAVIPIATSPVVTPIATTPVVAPVAIAPAPLPVVKTELPPATPSVVNNFYVSGSNNVVNTVIAVNSVIRGTSGNDELVGTDVAETLQGGFGADVLKGGFGDDILIGNQDNDQLFGGEGADVLWGGLGDDLICPNQGNDISYGNSGADRFILCKGQDTIKDFNFAEGDRILVFGDNPVSYGMSGGNFQIYRGAETTTLEGVSFATFDPTKAVLMMG
jgi:hypothetical protein